MFSLIFKPILGGWEIVLHMRGNLGNLITLTTLPWGKTFQMIIGTFNQWKSINHITNIRQTKKFHFDLS